MIKKYLIVLLLVIIVAFLFWGSVTLQNFFNDIESVFQKYAEENYFLSVSLFLVLSVVSVMFFAFSSVWLVPVAVPIWGSFFTFVLLLLGWLVGGVVAYGIGRFAGPPVLRYFISKEKTNYYSEHLLNGKHSLNLVLLTRFILPSEIPGYALGILRYHFGKYLFVTFLSEIPFALFSVYAVEAILKKDLFVFGFLAIAWFMAAMVLLWTLKKSWPREKFESTVL